MTDTTTLPDVADLANELFEGLTADSSFELPAVDFNDDLFKYPNTPPIELDADIRVLDEAALTNRKVGGTGMFDGLMVALEAHLEREYKASRITGAEYTKAYIALTQSALSSAVQYLLQKDQAYWQAGLVQAQARTAEAQIVSERINAEIAKANLLRSRNEAYLAAANYALSKMKLAESESQIGQIQSETVRIDYDVSHVMPKTIEKATKEIQAIGAQISHTTAQENQVLYQTASILPAQKRGIEAETAIKVYQLSDQLPSQVSNVDADTAHKVYQTQFQLPAQIDLVNEQMEAARAQTMDHRSNQTTTVKGAIGKQKDLHQEQITSYRRDAEMKMVKSMLDTWMTQKTVDEGLTAPTSLQNTAINAAVNKLLANLSL